MLKKRMSIILALVLMISCLLTGCGNAAGEAQAVGAEKVLTVTSNMNMTTMEPWKSTSSGDPYIFDQIYSKLVESYRGRYYPDLAESWECAEDGRTWTFNLTPEFYWQRGNDLFGDELVEVTAEDVKYSLEYVMDPENACARLEDLRSSIETIEVIDDKTIRIVTREIDVLFLYKMAAICIMPRKAGETGWEKNSSGIWEKDGKTFTFELQVGTNDPVRMNCAVLIATMLGSCGFDCNSKAIEWGTHIADMDAGKCPMFIDGGFSGIDGPMKVMHTDNTGIFSPNPGYSDKEVDAILEEAWRTTDDKAREELITRAQEEWLKDTVYIPMFFAYNFQAYNGERLKGFFEVDANSMSFNLTSRLRNADIAADE